MYNQQQAGSRPMSSRSTPTNRQQQQQQQQYYNNNNYSSNSNNYTNNNNNGEEDEYEIDPNYDQNEGYDDYEDQNYNSNNDKYSQQQQSFYSGNNMNQYNNNNNNFTNQTQNNQAHNLSRTSSHRNTPTKPTQQPQNSLHHHHQYLEEIEQPHHQIASSTTNKTQKSQKQQQQRPRDPLVAKLEEELYTERFKRDDSERRLLLFEERCSSERLEDDEVQQRRVLEMYVTAALMREDRKEVYAHQLKSFEALGHENVVEQLEKVKHHVTVERSVVDALHRQLEARTHAARAQAAKEREKTNFYRTMLIRRMRQLEEHVRMVCGNDHWLLRLAPELADREKPFVSVTGLKLAQSPAARVFYANQHLLVGEVVGDGGRGGGGGGGGASSLTPTHQGQLHYQNYDPTGTYDVEAATNFANKVLMASVSPLPPAPLEPAMAMNYQNNSYGKREEVSL